MDPDIEPDEDVALHTAGRVAAYRWGTLTLETSALAPTEGRAIGQALAGVLAGSLSVTSDVEQRGSLALIHELVHLQQDLSTGLGAWDHLATREAMTRLCYQAKWFVTRFTPAPYSAGIGSDLAERGPSPFADQVQEDLLAVRSRVIARRLLRRSRWWEGPGMLDAMAEAGIAETPDEGLGDFSLREMFETEAAAHVWSTVTGARYDDQSLEWLEEHRSLWSLDNLPEVYTNLIHLTAGFMAGPDEEVDDAWMSRNLRLVLFVTTFLVDWASAYPPPPILVDDRTAARYNPVLRLVVGLRALRKMPREPFSELVAAVLDSDQARAEEVLSGWSAVRYLTSDTIYAAWIQHLTPLAEASAYDAPLFEARCQAMQARLLGKSPKGLVAVADACTLVQVIVDGVGIRGLMFGAQLLDTSRVLMGLLERHQDVAVYEWLYEDRPFRCPWGRASTCEVVEDRCRTGLTSVTELPQHGCRVRNDLKQAGFAI